MSICIALTPTDRNTISFRLSLLAKSCPACHYISKVSFTYHARCVMTTKRCEERATSPTVELLKASAKGKLHSVIRAINEGAELAVNKNGHTALHIASYKGFLDIVRILLSAGCELDIQDDKGDTALHRACIAGHDHIVRRLIEEGCSVDRQNQLGDGALHEAASRGYSHCVKALIAGRANIGLRNKNKDTAIHLACANSHAGSLRLLLSSFPHSSPKNEQGDTPLHVAVRFGHVTCARVLISARCTVDMQNKRGDTALHIATIARHRKLARVLLDVGAEAKTLLNVDGKSALDIAKDNDDGETAIMLMSGPRHGTGGRARGRTREKVGIRQRSHSEPRKGDERRDGTDDITRNAKEDFYMESRPKSATLPRKRYIQARAKWRRHERRKLENSRVSSEPDFLDKQYRRVTVDPYLVPQLYSLYRDECGNVRQKPVVDQLPNPTPELVNSITVAVENTKGELLHEIQKTNHLLEKRLDRLENDTEFRVAKLDQITKERINAERMQCLHRIDRRATLERSLKEHKKNASPAISSRPVVKRGLDAQGLENRCQTCPIDYFEGTVEFKNREWGQSTKNIRATPANEHPVFVDRDVEHLQPYKTVRINRAGQPKDVATPKYGTMSSKSALNFRTSAQDQLNRSDSAYGSLSPQHALDPEDPVIPYHEITSKPQENKILGDCIKVEYGTLSRRGKGAKTGRQTVPPIPHFQESYGGHVPPQEAEVVQKVAQQFFENVTSAMEDWYERRLNEVTERQQMEFGKRVEELENRVRLLQTPSIAEHDKQ